MRENGRSTGAFGVNILAAHRCEAPTNFAGSRDDRFTDTAWELVRRPI